MKTVLAAIIFLGICIFGMCFNIIFRKDGKFPETEVSKNPEMKKLGIKCLHEMEQEMRMKDRQKGKDSSCPGTYSDSCVGCSFYPYEQKAAGK